MSSPIDSLLFVHAAILAESAALEARGEGALDKEAAMGLREDLATFRRVLDGHTHGEEVGLFPALDEKLPHYSDGYRFDHEEERALMDELDALLAGAAEGDFSTHARLRRQLTVLRTHAESHVRKENGVVLPLVRERFSVPEQGGIVRHIVGSIPPGDMPLLVPWIIDRITLDEAERYVGVLKAAMPPEVFEKAKGWIAEGVAPDRVTALRARVPELAAA